MSIKIQILKAKIAEMEALMSSFSKLGATDTEPDGHWQFALVQAAAKGKLSIPKSASDWELFSDRRGAGSAARKMSAKARNVCEFIIRNNMSGELTSVIRDHCWRITWPN